MGNIKHFVWWNRWWLAVLAAIFFLTLLGYRFLFYPCQPRDAVPDTTALLLNWTEAKDRHSGTDSSDIPTPLNVFPELVADYQAFRAFLQGGPAVETGLLMVQNLGESSLALAAVVDAPAFSLEERLSSFQVEVVSFRGYSVYRLSLSSSLTLAVARYRNLLLFGRLPLQVEAGIAQLRQAGGGWLPKWEGGSRAYLRADNLLSLGTGIFTAEARQSLARLEQWCAGIELELGHGGDTLAISGRLSMIRPSRSFSIPAPSRGEDILAYLPQSIAWCFRQSVPESGDESSSVLFERHIRPWLGGEMAWAAMGLPGKAADSQVCLLSVNSPETAAQGLSALAAELGSLQAYDYQSFQVQQVLAEGLLTPLGFKAPNPYFVLLGDYVAASSSQMALEQLISNIIVNNTLAQEERFLGLYAREAAGPKAWLFVQTPLCSVLLPAFLQERKQAFTSLLRTYDALFLTISPSGALSGMAVRGPASAEPLRPILAWKAGLDAPAASAVQAFPLDENGPGYLVQDEAYALYLFGANGDRRWKVTLDGPVLGPVSLIDYYDGPLRDLAFTTPRSIRVLSVEGEAKGDFRIPLESPAISPLLVADLEGQGQYHFFVACANGFLFGWNRQGQPMPGWNPQAQLDSTARHAMAHFQYANKDYILALSDAGTLYAFQRNGSFRFEPVRMNVDFLSPPFFQAEGDIGRIALGDSEGFAHIINLEGAHFRLRLMPQALPGARFLFGNLTGDGRKDYLCYRDREMRAYYYEGNDFKPFFSENMAFTPDTVFFIARPDSHWIGLLNRTAQKIYLLDNKGNAVPGFPLAGSTPFVVTPLKPGGQLAVVSYGPSVYAYRLDF